MTKLSPQASLISLGYRFSCKQSSLCVCHVCYIRVYKFSVMWYGWPCPQALPTFQFSACNIENLGGPGDTRGYGVACVHPVCLYTGDFVIHGP